MGTMGVAIRMVISLAVVLCLLFVVARFARRGRPRAGGPEMSVISRCHRWAPRPPWRSCSWASGRSSSG